MKVLDDLTTILRIEPGFKETGNPTIYHNCEIYELIPRLNERGYYDYWLATTTLFEYNLVSCPVEGCDQYVVIYTQLMDKTKVPEIIEDSYINRICMPYNQFGWALMSVDELRFLKHQFIAHGSYIRPRLARMINEDKIKNI